MSLSLYLLWSYMLIGAYISGRAYHYSWTPDKVALYSIAWMWAGPIVYLFVYSIMLYFKAKALFASRSL